MGREEAADAPAFWHARVDDPNSTLGPTTYAVTVTTNVHAFSAAVTPITSRRRYTEFCELRDILAERQATLLGVSPSTLPLVPPKVLWSTAPSVVATRCAAFEELLNAIGKDEQLRVLPVVAAFVGAQPFPARTQSTVPSEAPSKTPAAAPKARTPVRPLFQDDDPTGDDEARAGRRLQGVQSILAAPEYTQPSTERRRDAGRVETAVAALTLVGAADAPLTREAEAAQAVAAAAAAVVAREHAAAQAALQAALQAAAAAKAAEAKAVAAAQAIVDAKKAQEAHEVAVPPVVNVPVAQPLAEQAKVMVPPPWSVGEAPPAHSAVQHLKIVPAADALEAQDESAQETATVASDPLGAT
jgi:PX domain